MKKFILLFLFGLASSVLNAEIRIELAISKIHCLYNFVDTISADRPSAIKTFFEQSPFFTQENKKVLQEFRSIINSSKDFDENKLVLESMHSRSISDFKIRGQSLIEENLREEFFEIIENFSPIYDKLIWENCESKLLDCKTRIENTISARKIGNALEKVKLFLYSEWPENEPFIVFLYPIPVKEGLSRSRSFGEAIQYVGIHVDAEGMDRKIGTICHEICHSLMNSMSKETKNRVFNFFMETDSECRFWTYCRLFEIIPTCVGNGWVNELLTGELDRTNWYEDEFVNSLSKGVFPNLKKYLLAGKTIDKAFAEECIRVFSDRFPKAEKNFENIFCGVYLIGNPDSFDPRKVFGIIKQKFYFAGYHNISSPIAHPFTISGARKTPYNVVLAANDSNLQELEKFIEEQPSLADYKDKLLKPGARYIFATIDSHNKAMIIMKSADYAELRRFFDLIVKAGELQPDKKFMIYHES
jgi:hypothetical protein